MAEEITVRYRWTVQELIRGCRWHMRQRVRRPFRFLAYLLLVLFFVTGFAELWKRGPCFNGFLLIGIGCYFVFAFAVLRPWIIRRRFAKRPDRNADVEWNFGAEKIRAQYALASSEFSWRALTGVVQTPDGFLLCA